MINGMILILTLLSFRSLMAMSLGIPLIVYIYFYYIQSSEIQENIVDIYCIFYIFTSENIKSYIFTPQEVHIMFLDYL